MDQLHRRAASGASLTLSATKRYALGVDVFVEIHCGGHSGAGKAAITGDFVLLGSEVNPIMKTLRQNGIEVTAVSHTLTEEPRLFFMHFWANDNAVKLAKGVRSTLDLTNSEK